MRKINKQTREKIISQALSEVDFAEKYKSEVKKRWALNEDLYYGRKKESNSTRSNVMLPKAQGFVDTLLAKVRIAPYIEFKKTEEADLRVEEKVNSLWRFDSSPTQGNWSFKDLLNKKFAALYGRAIFEYHASSSNGRYGSHLSIVDPYDFLIDPSAGGLDIEKARYLGRKNVIKTKEEIQNSIKDYIKKEVDALFAGGQVVEKEDSDKDNRYIALKTDSSRFHTHEEKQIFSFIEWYTTYKGTRYYLLIHKESGIAIRVEQMNKIFKSNLYPFSSYATSPDASEFWTPGPMDAVREIFIIQNITINQMLDNSEQINKPMRAYNVNALSSPALLKYRKDGLVPVRNTFRPSDIYTFETPQIQTPITVYNILDSIQALESGITPDAKGMSNENRVGILESNLANVADRLGLLNRSYSDAYNRLGLLYYNGLREHLTPNTSVSILGKKGVAFEKFKRAEIIDSKSFNVIIGSSNEDIELDIRAKREKIEFLASQVNNPMVNQKALFRLQAKISGFDPNETNILLSENDLSLEVIADAAHDIQTILKGGFPATPRKASPQYMEEIIKYIDNYGSELKPNVLMEMTRYLEILRPLAVQNEVFRAQEEINRLETQAPGDELLPGQQTGQERIIREQLEQ